MTILDVRHTTIYRYSRPVQLGDHRLMLRPRDSHDLRIIQTRLNLLPTSSIRWIHDVFGNSIAIASFAGPTTELRIESHLRLETFVVKKPVFQITPEAVSYDKLGIAVAPVPSELAQRSAESEQFKKGLLVTDVNSAGPAYKKLIEERDIILEVLNPAPRMVVTSQGELERALGKVKSGDYATLLVYNLDQGQTRVESLRVQ